MNGHLSSAQLDGVLRGQASDETAAHVKDCAQCGAEVESLRMVFGGMRTATAALAEQQRRIGVKASRRRVPRMAWALAVSALLVSVAAPVAVHWRRPVAVGMTPIAPAMISDEALLNSVRNDLDASVPESLQPLASTSTNATSTSGTTTSGTTRKN